MQEMLQPLVERVHLLFQNVLRVVYKYTIKYTVYNNTNTKNKTHMKVNINKLIVIVTMDNI